MSDDIHLRTSVHRIRTLERQCRFNCDVRLCISKRKSGFFAEKDHLAFVSQSLSDVSIEIEYHEIDIPIGRSDFFTLIPAFITCTRLFRSAVACDARMIVFSSVTSPCLISIKLLAKAFGSVKCAVVPHSILEDVLKRRAPHQC